MNFRSASVQNHLSRRLIAFALSTFPFLNAGYGGSGVDTFDARWQAGKALEKFVVVRTEALENHKALIVKMKLTDAEVEQEVTYIVVGNDPSMVFRKEDYDKASGVGSG